MREPEGLIHPGREKRVLVLETDQIFGGAVLNLIANQESLQTISLRLRGQIDLLQEIQKHAPDVVVMDDSVLSKIIADLFRLLRQIPNLKIVVLCTEDNHVEVYTKQQSTIGHCDDLFNLL
jgi:DNA-binding NarL/FixJ family response regulator